MNKIFFLALVAIFVSGCTGTSVKVTPEITELDSPISSYKYNSLGITESQKNNSFHEEGNIPKAFSLELKKTNLAQNVYYPMRDKDIVDYELLTNFNVEIDAHGGASFAKGFFVGFTLFLLEPFIWFDHDYTITGAIDIIKDGNKVKSIESKAKATASMKWLSLSEAGRLKGEALIKAQRSVFFQLINKLNGLTD